MPRPRWTVTGARAHVLAEERTWRATPSSANASSGRAVPRVTVPFANKVVAARRPSSSRVRLCFAVVVATALHVPVGGMLVFAAWCATIALFAWRFPILWRSQLEYIVTERHVIWRRGPHPSLDRAQANQLRAHPLDTSDASHGRPRRRPRRARRARCAARSAHAGRRRSAGPPVGHRPRRRAERAARRRRPSARRSGSTRASASSGRPCRWRRRGPTQRIATAGLAALLARASCACWSAPVPSLARVLRRARAHRRAGDAHRRRGARLLLLLAVAPASATPRSSAPCASPARRATG